MWLNQNSTKVYLSIHKDSDPTCDTVMEKKGKEKRDPQNKTDQRAHDPGALHKADGKTEIA